MNFKISICLRLYFNYILKKFLLNDESVLNLIDSIIILLKKMKSLNYRLGLDKLNFDLYKVDNYNGSLNFNIDNKVVMFVLYKYFSVNDLDDDAVYILFEEELNQSHHDVDTCTARISDLESLLEHYEILLKVAS